MYKRIDHEFKARLAVIAIILFAISLDIGGIFGIILLGPASIITALLLSGGK